ncbi:MAG: hypothetical protein IKJ45_11855, partial [Kiritimatiellae bacterium]|nr:hypothetical protein [Kiritimatiellia bacterium]
RSGFRGGALVAAANSAGGRLVAATAAAGAFVADPAGGAGSADAAPAATRVNSTKSLFIRGVVYHNSRGLGRNTGNLV